MNASSIRLFRAAALYWLLFYLFSISLMGEAAWSNAPLALFSASSPMARGAHHWADAWITAHGWSYLALMALLTLAMLRWPRWYVGLAIWLLFRLLDHRMWLASNGGLQLMGNMLFWVALMSARGEGVVPRAAFWIARLQLLLAYAVAAAHKLTGTAWLDGSAMSRAAGDPLFNLQWLLAFPALCSLLTWVLLFWMVFFPVAVWWSPTRRIWLIVGVVFHLSTAVFMGIPQMGFAFIACYALWLCPEEADRILGRVRRPFRRSGPGMLAEG